MPNLPPDIKEPAKQFYGMGLRCDTHTHTNTLVLFFDRLVSLRFGMCASVDFKSDPLTSTASTLNVNTARLNRKCIFYVHIMLTLFGYPLKRSSFLQHFPRLSK